MIRLLSYYQHIIQLMIHDTEPSSAVLFLILRVYDRLK